MKSCRLLQQFRPNAAFRSVPVQWAPQPTNGIVYFKAKLPFDAIPDKEKEELLPYFPLFAQVNFEKRKRCSLFSFSIP